ncbi:50S ribosomal protein L23 [Candidatus Woesearchaeota archaeon]|nr:50S ribosomal protein L23 [Candidatus Woesearchaeota archaeon]
MNIVKYPLTTEKAVKLIESENKLLFVVELKSTKAQIKQDVEKLFKVKVASINTLITSDGEKRAYVKLAPETPAMDVITQLGLM